MHVTQGLCQIVIVLAALTFAGSGSLHAQAPCDLQWVTSVPVQGYFLDVAPSGDWFVSDAPTRTISRYSPNGTFLYSWSSQEEDSTWHFVRPFGLTVSSDDKVYVADYEQHVVLVFDLEGHFLGKVGEPGTGPGQLLQPYDVAVDSQGQLYVSDRGNARVDKFDAAGSFVKSWGSNGFGPQQFANITCLTVGASDNVFVADQLGYVRRFTSDGTFMARFDGTESGEESIDVAIGLTLTRNGSLLHVVDWDDSEITSFNIEGQLYSRCGMIGHGEGRYFFPGDCDHEGDTLLILDAGNNRIVRIDESLVPIRASTWGRIKSRLAGER